MEFFYEYTKAVDIERLTLEIQESTIPVVLLSIDQASDDFKVVFKAELTPEYKVVLDDLVSAHINEPLPVDNDSYKVEAFPHYASDGTPHVYSTPRPIGHYSYFTSSGDDKDDPNAIGTSPRCQFRLAPEDASKTLDITFNEDIYLKDGLMLPRDAPFGAAVDIEVVHPVNGRILYFGKDAPIMGSVPLELNTDDRALIPKGMIIRITVHNSSGTNGEDPPTEFVLAGRFELYRCMPEIEF